MSIILPKYIVEKVKKIHKNLEQNSKLAKELSEYFQRIDVDISQEEELLSSKIVNGKVVTENETQYLKVEGYSSAQENHDGSFCHQVCRGEDWYTGELYFRINDKHFLQIFYEC